jgi:hypothetical protein
MSTITTSKQQQTATERGQWLPQQDYVGTAGHVAWERKQHQQIRRRVLAHPRLSQMPVVLSWLELEQQRVDGLQVIKA